jgi:hypothetical protein
MTPPLHTPAYMRQLDALFSEVLAEEMCCSAKLGKHIVVIA